MVAGHASLPQQLWVNGSEHGSVPAVGHRDLDLHQARSVHDDAIQRLMFANQRDELAFVKGPHVVELTDQMALRERMCSGRPAGASRREATPELIALGGRNIELVSGRGRS